MKQKLFVGLLLCSIRCVGFAQIGWHDHNGPWAAIHPAQFAFAYQPEGTEPEAIFLAQYNGVGRAYLARSTNDGTSWQTIEDIPNAFAVAVDPNNPSMVYAAHGTGGHVYLKKSTDGGETWPFTGNGLPNMEMTCIAVSPHDGNMVLLGSIQSSTFSLWQSTDAGLNWTQNEGFQNFHLTVTTIVFDPTEANIIYVTGTDGATNENGVWKSVDGGQTWQRKVEGMSNIRATSLGINHVNTDSLFVCCLDQFYYESHVYMTTNGGEQWALSYESPEAVQLVEVTVAAGGRSVFAAGRSNTNGYPQVYSFGVIKSDDAGATWSPCNDGLFGRLMETVSADPRRNNFVLAGAHGIVYRSTNAGLLWMENNVGLVRLSASSAVSCGSLVMTTATVPDLGGKYGGVVRSLDGGAKWQIVDEEAEGTYTRIYDVIITNPQNRVMFAGGRFGRWGHEDPGMRATILRSTDDGTSWGAVHFDENDPVPARSVWTIAVDSKNPGYVYAGTTFNEGSYYHPPAFLRSTNAGASWFEGTPPTGENTAWITDIAVDPSSFAGTSSTTLFLGGERIGLLKSTDRGTTWSSTGFSDDVYSVSLSTLDPRILLVGSTSGIHRSPDGGASWELVLNSRDIVGSIIIHPGTPSVVYASSWNFRLVYKSTDEGKTWFSFNENLPEAIVNRMGVDVSDGNKILSATSNGVFSIPHIWTGTLAVSTTWCSGETYLVEGTLTIPEGKSLEIKPGATVKAFPNAKIRVEGALTAGGSSESYITFTSNSSGESWQGIEAANAGANSVTLSYANILHADIGVNVGTHTDLAMDHCRITDAGIGVQIIPVIEGIDLHKDIISCEFLETKTEGIHLENFSDVTIEGNTITGSGNKNGISLRLSSPEIQHSSMEGFNVGLYCQAGSSPVLQYAFNKIKFNDFGVHAIDGASPILGFSDPSAGGMNSIFGNQYWDVVLNGNCIVWAQNNWWGTKEDPKEQFSIEEGSELYYDPWLDYDPNEGGMNVVSGGSINGDDGRMSILPPIVRQVIVERLQNHHATAMTLLRSIIGDTSMPGAVKRWAVNQLLAVAQRMPSPNLSSYLVNLLTGNSSLARDIRAILPGSYIREHSLGNAMAAYDQNIQRYPNTPLERDALYGKLLYALYNQGDTSQGLRLRDLLQARYPGSYEAELADIQLQYYRSGTMQCPSSGGGPLNKSNGQSPAAGQLPKEFALSQNYPNPFNPSTTINYDLPVGGNVSLKVYDVLGKEVATLADEPMQAGYHQATLNATSLASGVYFYRLTAGPYSNVKKLVVLK